MCIRDSRQVSRRIFRRAGAVHLGVRPQDPLAEPAGSAVDDQDEVSGGKSEPGGVLRIENGADSGQFDEVVAAADGSEALGVPTGNVGFSEKRAEKSRVGHVQVGEACGELLRHRALDRDREDRDPAADVGSDQERVEHGRGHRGADRGALARVQVGHPGDVAHAGQLGDLVALVESVGLDPARRGGKNGHSGRKSLTGQNRCSTNKGGRKDLGWRHQYVMRHSLADRRGGSNRISPGMIHTCLCSPRCCRTPMSPTSWSRRIGRSAAMSCSGGPPGWRGRYPGCGSSRWRRRRTCRRWSR